MDLSHVSFAGAGRVGASFCREMFNAGYIIDMVVSATPAKGMAIADAYNAKWSDEPVFPFTTKLIIVAVPDRKLEEVLHNIKCSPDTLVVHTAGSYGTDLFPATIKKRGVIYPLQTFSENRYVSFRDLPFLLEADDPESFESLRKVAVSLGGKVYPSDAGNRKMLHLAAVFANNFTNHMLTEGKEIAARAGYTFEILIPLLNETVLKAVASGPENSQSGPAFRNDQNTLDKHLELLSFSPELQAVYMAVTKSIINYYKSRNSGEF
jgi:predicted short-subunit dehydrogenase-like oxidoreductase (DUF2520 family)